jgi:hypothetical protein
MAEQEPSVDLFMMMDASRRRNEELRAQFDEFRFGLTEAELEEIRAEAQSRIAQGGNVVRCSLGEVLMEYSEAEMVAEVTRERFNRLTFGTIPADPVLTNSARAEFAAFLTSFEAMDPDDLAALSTIYISAGNHEWNLGSAQEDN